MGLINPVSNFLQKLSLKLFADWQVDGLENVPPMGPLIIVANHQSNFDPPLLSTSLPRTVQFLAKKSIFQGGPIVSWFLRSWGAFPVDREKIDIGAYRWSLDQLSRDGAIVMFPEGSRNPGRMARARPGVAQLAIKTQAPILPVGITGTEKLGTPFRVFNPTGKIRVNIGSAFTLPEITGVTNKELLYSITDMIMERVAALLPAKYQGTYKLKTVTPSVAKNSRP